MGKVSQAIQDARDGAMKAVTDVLDDENIAHTHDEMSGDSGHELMSFCIGDETALPKAADLLRDLGYHVIGANLYGRSSIIVS